MLLNKWLFGGALAIMFAFSSCKSDSTTTTDDTTTPTPVETQAAPPATDGNTIQMAPQSATDAGQTAPQTAPANGGMQIQPASTAPAAGGSGKVNPPHGQPGHTCDLPVGAPLPG